MNAIPATKLPATSWQSVRLADVCQFKPPKSIPRKTLDDDSPVSFVPMGDLGELTKHFEAKTVRRFAEVVKGYTYFADGDVLCAKITPCFENGKLGIAQNLENGVGFGSSEFVVMRSKGGILPEFLYYYLSRDTFREAGQAVMSGAVGHKRVPNEYFENLEIPLTPLDEQKRIVAVLDQAFAALDCATALTEESHSDARETFSAYLEEVFSDTKQDWVNEKLGDVCSKIGSGATPKGGASSYKSEGVSLIRSLNVHDRDFREEKLALIDDEQAGRLSNVAVQPQDVLFNITGASIARCCLAPEVWLPARVNQHVAIIRPDPKILLPEFLCMLLTSRSQKYKLLRAGHEGGSTRQAITKSQLRDFSAYFPRSTDLQTEIVANLDRFEKASHNARNVYAQKLSDIEQLRQSLLQRAFAGQLN